MLAKCLIESADHAKVMDKYDRWSSLLSHMFESNEYPGRRYDQNVVN